MSDTELAVYAFGCVLLNLLALRFFLSRYWDGTLPLSRFILYTVALSVCCLVSFGFLTSGILGAMDSQPARWFAQ